MGFSPNALNKLAAMISNTFSISASYNVDDYCVYNGEFYRAITTHSGDWDATHFTKISIGDCLDNHRIIANRIAPAFSAANTYNAAEVVSYKGRYYSCKENNISGDFDSTKWSEFIYNIKENNNRSITDSTVLANVFKSAAYISNGTKYNIYCSGSVDFDNTVPWGLNAIVEGNGNSITLDWKNSLFYKTTFNNFNIVITSTAAITETADARLFYQCAFNNCRITIKPEVFNNNAAKVFTLFDGCSLKRSIVLLDTGTITKNTSGCYSLSTNSEFIDGSIVSNTTSTADANGAWFKMFDGDTINRCTVVAGGEFYWLEFANNTKINNSTVNINITNYQSDAVPYCFNTSSVDNCSGSITISNTATAIANDFAVFYYCDEITNNDFNITTSCAYTNLYVFNTANNITANTFNVNCEGKVGEYSVCKLVHNVKENKINLALDSALTIASNADIILDCSYIGSNIFDYDDNSTEDTGYRNGIRFFNKNGICEHNKLNAIGDASSDTNNIFYGIFIGNDIIDVKIKNNEVIMNISDKRKSVVAISAAYNIVESCDVNVNTTGNISVTTSGIYGKCASAIGCNVYVNTTCVAANYGINTTFNSELTLDGSVPQIRNCRVIIYTPERGVANQPNFGIGGFNVKDCYIEVHSNCASITGTIAGIFSYQRDICDFKSYDNYFGSITGNTIKMFVHGKYPAYTDCIRSNASRMISDNDCLIVCNNTITGSSIDVRFIKTENNTPSTGFTKVHQVVTRNYLHYVDDITSTGTRRAGIINSDNSTSSCDVSNNIFTRHRFAVPLNPTKRAYSTLMSPSFGAAYHNLSV